MQHKRDMRANSSIKTTVVKQIIDLQGDRIFTQPNG
jgi:hypothetical protein